MAEVVGAGRSGVNIIITINKLEEKGELRGDGWGSRAECGIRGKEELRGGRGFRNPNVFLFEFFRSTTLWYCHSADESPIFKRSYDNLRLPFKITSVPVSRQRDISRSHACLILLFYID